MRMAPAGSSVVFLMVTFCPVIKPELRDLKPIQPMINDLANSSTLKSSNEFKLKLRAPVVYTVEDLKMSLSLLLTILTVIFIWYKLARCIIYLAYHTNENKIEDLEDIEDDQISV